MTKRSIVRRWRARLDGERGFTILETMIAITVIFASLTALAYTATIGFKYIGYSRERIQATGIANQVMEKIRGLPYANLTAGMSSNDPTFATDTNIKSCSGVYRFLSCTNSGNGTGEKIVYSALASGTSVAYLVNHTGTITEGGVTYTWTSYVTNENTASNPYRVTVLVTWATGPIANGTANLVKLQSLFWSPTGCVSSSTHPFAAPCQPFFYGTAEVPDAAISLTGQLHNSFVDFESGEIHLPGTSVTAQQEQTIDLSAKTSPSGLAITNSTGRTTAGGAEANYQADDDITSSTGKSAGGSPTGAAASLSATQSDSPGTIGLQLAVPSGDTSGAGLSTAASSSDTYACPPSGTRENDALLCAGGQVKQSGTVTATVPVSHVVSTLGAMTAVRVQAPSTASSVLANRTAVSGYDGLMAVSATRYLGTIQIGGFPTAGMTTVPAGMSTTNTNDTNYCVRLVGYQDSVSGSAGPRTSTNPAATINAGTFYYYSAGSYLNKSVTDSTLDSLAVTCDSGSQTVGTHTVQWKFTIAAGGIQHATAPSPTSTVSSSDSQTRTEIQATTTPFKLTGTYTLIVDGTTEISLTIAFDPGQLSAHAVYGAPPTAG